MGSPGRPRARRTPIDAARSSNSTASRRPNSPTRTFVGPLPAIVESRRLGFADALRHGRSLRPEVRGVDRSLRIAFGSVIGALFLGWFAAVMGSEGLEGPRGLEGSFDETLNSLVASRSVWPRTCLFAFAYVAFVLDAALDAAFVSLTEGIPESEFDLDARAGGA